MRYSRLLEEADFAGNKADYVVMLVFNATILLVGSSSQGPCHPLEDLNPFPPLNFFPAPAPTAPDIHAQPALLGIIAGILRRLHLGETQPACSIERVWADNVSYLFHAVYHQKK